MTGMSAGKEDTKKEGSRGKDGVNGFQEHCCVDVPTDVDMDTKWDAGFTGSKYTSPMEVVSVASALVGKMPMMS